MIIFIYISYITLYIFYFYFKFYLKMPPYSKNYQPTDWLTAVRFTFFKNKDASWNDFMKAIDEYGFIRPFDKELDDEIQ